jgi:signal transduction histidine kinase
MKSSNWPIRSKIIALVAVPIAALLALWLFATTLTVGPASSLLATRTLLDELGVPGETLVAELQQERRLSVVYLAGRGQAAALREQRSRTDQAVAEFRRRASGGDLRNSASQLLDTRIEQTFTALDALPAGRGFIDGRAMDARGALGLYSGMVDSAFRVFSAMVSLPDEEVSRQARALTTLGQARELLAQADALVAGAGVAKKFADSEYGQLVQTIGSQRFLYAAAVAELPDADRAAYQRLTEGDAFVRLRAMEEELVAKGRPGAAPPVNAQTWQNSYDSVQQQLRDFELAAADRLAERSVPVAVGILVRLALAGVLGLAAVVVSAIIALRVGRSLIRRLTSLRAAALELAGERLPAVIERLRRGEEVDLAREAPPLEYGSDEIGQLGQAFSEVQRSAVQSAVDQAVLRRGLNEVFLNIARRSQTLLHRQLALLDRMERRASDDPEELADLFRVDHLATRMRRHAEDLVILAGAVPGRGWRNPVPIVDVIRGAISEVEDYGRVDIVAIPAAAAVGRAVGDLIHLLAELIENGTSYSPPQTRVQITGQVVPNGYAIEIEDRGLGMTPEAIADANRRLADPPSFDPANSARLGLFVVAQLGARHGVKVQLRPSPYGGVTAVALVPSSLVTDSGSPLALPGRPTAPAGRGPAQPAGLVSAAPRAGTDIENTQEIGRVTPIFLPSSPEGRPGTEPERRPGRAGRLTAVPTRQSARTPDPASGSAPASAPAPAPASAPASTSGSEGLPRLPRRTVDRLPAPPTPPAAVPAQRTPAPLSEDGLPRRIRQTSLAPQLRDAGPASARTGSAVNGEVGEEPALRSPEEVRAVMSALQAGTARGRQAAGWPGSDAAPAAGSTASGPPVAGSAASTPAVAGSVPADPETDERPARLAPDGSPLTDPGADSEPTGLGRDA